jgi:hypothetical protein
MEDARTAPEEWWEPFLRPDDESSKPPAPGDERAEGAAGDQPDSLDATLPQMRE